MHLIVDLGNSRAKVAVFENAKVLELFEWNYETFFKSFSERLIESGNQLMFKGEVLKGGMYVSTLEFGHEIHGLLESLGLKPFTRELKLPFKSEYLTMDTIGLDRLAALAAVSKLKAGENRLVIDSGTCVTIDFLNTENVFKGGWIIPGLKMRFDAMHQLTGNLPLINPEEAKTKIDEANLFGRSTFECMSLGGYSAFITEIQCIIDKILSKFNSVEIIVTGGDSNHLVGQIKNSIFAFPNLVLEGLDYIYTCNYTGE